MNQWIACCGLNTCADCPQMNDCPMLGRIAANNPSVLERLTQLREEERNEAGAAETAATATMLGIL